MHEIHTQVPDLGNSDADLEDVHSSWEINLRGRGQRLVVQLLMKFGERR